jgi:YbbR domain-containing protein
VEQVNIPRSLLPTDVQPAKVSVTLSGAALCRQRWRPEDVSARVDLSRADDEIGGAREGPSNDPCASMFVAGVRAEARPEGVRVTVERQERRTVPVCVDKIDVPPPGFSIEEPITTEPSEATISGPRRNIDAVECAAPRCG